MDKDAHRYDDIINLPHPTSSNHPRMSLYDRAAQFAPFAALTGYDVAIKETARLTDERLGLGEQELEEMNECIQFLIEHLAEHPEVRIIYFKQDERKAGGAYLTARNRVKKIDEYERLILLEDGTRIPFDDVYEIELTQEDDM